MEIYCYYFPCVLNFGDKLFISWMNLAKDDFVPLFITLNTCFENRNGIQAGCSHSYSQNFWKLHRFHVTSDFRKKGILNFKLKLLKN